MAVSQSLRSLALETARGTTIDVIPNGVDTRLFRPGNGTATPDLLFVGRLIERKGVEFLLRAFGDLARQHAAVTLEIAGDGPEKAPLQALARQLGVAERVSFLGHLDRSALAERYRRAAVFVLPAMRDAMPNAALEAMASGLALVVTPGGAGDLVEGNGFVIPPRDPNAIREAVGRYLADRELLAAHRERSRALAQAVSWQAVAEYFHELYRALTSEQPEVHSAALAARRAAVLGRRYAPRTSLD